MTRGDQKSRNEPRPKIYLCFEPHHRIYAQKLSAWEQTNPQAEYYDRRVEVPVTSPQAEGIKQTLSNCISAADVSVCIIALSTCLDEWIDWELSTSKRTPKRNGLVGIMLRERSAHPPAMENSGAIFVPFQRGAVERAIQWAFAEEYGSDNFTLIDE